MEYIFSAGNQALWAVGKLVQATTNAGQVLPILRDPITGQFVEIAKGVVSTSAQPLISPVDFAMGAAQIYQTHRGFTTTLNGISAIQSSLGVLQATTTLIGVGTVAGVALSAVNLHQTLKLREDVKQLRLEVKDGFIDLKATLKDQGVEVIQRLDEVAQDVKFTQHRLEFIKAYGRFLEATKLIKTALAIQDGEARKIELANARQTLGEALAIYNSPHLLSETSAAGQLRRLECAWAIEQTIVVSYQLQNEPAAVSDRLSDLQAKIRQDCFNVIDSCKTEDELDFLFPEITRIHERDLAVLQSWQDNIDWVRSLPLSELKLLESADFTTSEITNDTNVTFLTVPTEQVIYDSIKQKSHISSLLAQLKFLMKPELRREYENYIEKQGAIAAYKALVSSNLKNASNLTVANLYWHFKVIEESVAATV